MGEEKAFSLGESAKNALEITADSPTLKALAQTIGFIKCMEVLGLPCPSRLPYRGSGLFLFEGLSFPRPRWTVVRFSPRLPP